MRISWRRTLLATSAACLLVAPRVAAAAPLNILMVGSSHTWGIKKPLRRIFASYGIPTTINVIAPIHGSLAGNRKEALHEINDGPNPDLPGDHYDWVVLQENGGLRDEIGWVASVSIRNAAIRMGGDALYYMTFPTERDFTTGVYPSVLDLLIDGPCAVPTCPATASSPSCCRGYSTLAHAAQLNMRVAPVGQSVVDFHLDRAHAVDEIYGPDGHHLNAKGKYLAALTIFATIERALPDFVWEPVTLGAAAGDYKRIARDAVLGPPSGMQSTWNLAADN